MWYGQVELVELELGKWIRESGTRANRISDKWEFWQVASGKWDRTSGNSGKWVRRKRVQIVCRTRILNIVYNTIKLQIFLHNSLYQFSINNYRSGQILFERWTIGLYNVFFTALPPFAMGLFDKICSADTMLKYPALYKPSQNAQLFNVKVFWIWIINALLHSLMLFWLPMLVYENETIWGNGKLGGYLVLGNIVYTVMKIIFFCKLWILLIFICVFSMWWLLFV